MKLSSRLILLANIVILSFGVVVFPAFADADDTSPIITKDKPVSATHYRGFKLFRNWCVRCHATYDQGIAGSNLANNLRLMSQEDFDDIVENGKVGAMGNMPSWKNNPEIMENRDKIYAYLKSRLENQ